MGNAAIDREALSALEQEYGLPEGLLHAQMMAESSGNPNAVSPKGALGLFQFMPKTAEQYGIDPMNPQQAAQGAAQYNSDLMNRFGGDVNKALAAYNWGQGNVARQGMENAPQETQAYVQRITNEMSDVPEGFVLEESLAQDNDVPEGFVLEESFTKPKKSEEKLLKEEKDRMETQAARSMSKGILPTMTAYAANAMQAIPFSDEAGSAIAALAGYGEGETWGDRYNNLQKAQQAMRTAGETLNPEATALGKVGSMLAVAPALGGGGEQAATSLIGAMAKGAAQGAKAGAGYGALYGAGETDSFKPEDAASDERIRNAVSSGLIGGVTGGVLGAPLGAASYKLASSAKSTPNVVKKVIQKIEGEGVSSSNELKPIIEGPIKSKDDLFSKTYGQMSQNADVQRFENAALSGTVTPEAQQAGFDFIKKQNSEIKSFLNKIGNKDLETTNINALIDDVGNTILQGAKTASSGVDDAYELARNVTGGVRKGVKISRDDIRNGLWKNIGNIRRAGQYDVSNMPNALKEIKSLAKYSLKGKDGNISPTYLGDMENWRTRVTNAAYDKRGTSEGKFLRKMVSSYDDFMMKTAANSVEENDRRAIMAFRDAVSKRKEFGRLFESNKLVQKLANNELSVDDTRRLLMGTGSIKGKSQMADNLKAVLDASGKERPVVQRDLQTAFIKRIAEKAEGGFAPDSRTEQLISPAKLKTGLKDLFIEQEDFSKILFGDDAIKTAKRAIKELNLMTSQQISTRNPSGSGEFIMRGIMNQILNKSSILSTAKSVAEGTMKSAKEVAKTKEAIESFVGNAPRSYADLPKAKIWSSKAGAISGAASNMLKDKE